MPTCRRLQPPRPTPRRCGEQGTGVVGTLGGALAFLGFLFLAVHVLTGLYATSIVTAAANDAARAVGASPEDAQKLSHAETQLAKRLDGLKDVEASWTMNDDQVGLTVRASRPNLLPTGLHKKPPWSTDCGPC